MHTHTHHTTHTQHTHSTALDISEEHVKKPGNTFAMSPVTTDMTFGPSDFNAGSSLIPRANRYSKVSTNKLVVLVAL